MRTIILALFALAACSSPAALDTDAADILDSDPKAGSEGTAQAIGLLNFLNDAATSFELLDEDVPLDRRAAQNLIAHRDGPDGLPGTPDDDLFDTVVEIDAVPWVGPNAMGLLHDYVLDTGWVPEGDDLLGTWEGVRFTVDQADAVIELVNSATAEQLDHDVPLNVRAVDAILDARPLATVPQLAGVFYVGPTALERLRNHASVVVGAGEGESCAVTADCESGLRCEGVPFDGSASTGVCIDTTPRDGEWDDCSVDSDCGAGLVCIGAITWGANQGWCDQDWMANTFSSAPNATFAGSATAEDSVVVTGLATVPVDIVVTLDIDHPKTSNLVVVLTDPNGVEGPVWDHEGSPEGQVVVRAIPGDDMINGRWTLSVTDPVEGISGELVSWDLYLTSRWD